MTDLKINSNCGTRRQHTDVLKLVCDTLLCKIFHALLNILINIVLFLGHILQDYAKDDTKKLIDRIDKFCTGHWRERIYQRIFVTKMYLDHIRKSFFCSDSIFDPPLRFCSSNQLKSYSQSTYKDSFIL